MLSVMPALILVRNGCWRQVSKEGRYEERGLEGPGKGSRHRRATVWFPWSQDGSGVMEGKSAFQEPVSGLGQSEVSHSIAQPLTREVQRVCHRLVVLKAQAEGRQGLACLSNSGELGLARALADLLSTARNC